MAAHQGSTVLFCIFALTLLTLLAIPLTIWRFCSGDAEKSLKPWEKQDRKKKLALGSVAKQLSRPGTIGLLALWLVIFGLVYYVSVNSEDLTPFDPFDILQIPRDASSADIKRAWRKLSLEYHPDKNPDPKAHQYFAEYITKAYQALTDEEARKNYEKYGHPDGQQSTSVSVALPEWLFSADSKAAPFMLLGLVTLGIIVPLIIAAFYLFRTNKFIGPNQVMHETLLIFARDPRFGVKEVQSLVKIPDSLVVATELREMPVPSEQTQALADLRKAVLRWMPDLKDKALFWKRTPSVVKTHMFLIAHLERGGEEVPKALEKDYKEQLRMLPTIINEFINVALIPRPRPGLPPQIGFGWLTPAVGGIEMMQCLTQAVPVTVKRPAVGSRAVLDAPLLQLPHMTMEIYKKLGRKKVRALTDLQALSSDVQRDALASAGMTDEQIESVQAALLALPSVAFTAQCYVDGEDDITAGDVVTCDVHVVLRRASHSSVGFDAGAASSSTAVQAYAPHYPHPRHETWWFLLADEKTNSVWASTKANLFEAEQTAATTPKVFDAVVQRSEAMANSVQDGRQRKANRSENGIAAAPSQNGGDNGADKPIGQKVELKFQPLMPGKFDLVLLAMCDCWMGTEKAVPIALKINEPSKEEEVVEVKKRKKIEAASEGESDTDAAPQNGEERDHDGGSDADEDTSDEDDDYDYDSEETGSEVTDSEDESEQTNENVEKTDAVVKKQQ